MITGAALMGLFFGVLICTGIPITIDLYQRLFKKQEGTVTAEEMTTWFRSKYEPTTENTPRDDGEFVYIHGEPVDVRETLLGQFYKPDEDGDAELARAVKILESEDEWVPQPREEDPI